MNQPPEMSTTALADQSAAFMERFMRDLAGTFNIFAIHIGDRLGLYRALAEGGASTPAELAKRTHANERYVREWLEQQTVAGMLAVEDERADAAERRYRIPAGLVEPLTQCDSLNYLAPMAQLMAGAVRPLPQVVEAFRKGGGVPFEEFGPDLREGQAAANYPMYAHQLAQKWLPAMPDVHQRLLVAPPAHVADFGCGQGWSTIAMAKGYPNARVDGLDLDEPSIRQAKINAKRNRVEERVDFKVRDAGDPALAGQYDLVTAFECIHDMTNPVGALRTMRRLTAPGGAVMVMDERVNSKFTPGDDGIDWLMYGFSILHCLPVGLADGPDAAGTGTVMRSETLERYAREAGYARVEILPIENDMWRFYRLWL